MRDTDARGMHGKHIHRRGISGTRRGRPGNRESADSRRRGVGRAGAERFRETRGALHARRALPRGCTKSVTTVFAHTRAASSGQDKVFPMYSAQRAVTGEASLPLH